MKRKLLLLTLVLALLLCACSTGPDYSSNGESTYEPQTEAPEPFYYDEYGARFKLVDGTYDEYCIDEEYWEVVETPDSTAFTEISYWYFHSELHVVFRNSGAGYHYYDVPHEVWHEFKNAESKGSYFQEAIRNNYEYDRD